MDLAGGFLSYWGVVGVWAVLILVDLLWILLVACEVEMLPSYLGVREVGAPILCDCFLWYVRGPHFRVSLCYESFVDLLWILLLVF